MSRIRHASKNEDESEIDLTPMLDVVFIMLIFLLLPPHLLRNSDLKLIDLMIYLR